MSILTKAIGTAKKVKHALKDEIDRRTPVYLSPVRRLERVRTSERVCAMTFDDGPMNLPCSPDHHGGKPLTLVLLETLEAYGGKGTFDIVGDTSTNYPDEPGKHGSASWGGVAYDHYPDFNKDAWGGAAHCPELVQRILDGGHQITNHTYAHVLFGKKPLVYGARKHLNSLTEVTDDLQKLHTLLQKDFGYEMEYMRPPHYVDKIHGGFNSYDACAVMGYQYMAASFDGAGWLPCATYEQEVEACWKPIEAALKADPDALCGQIIFQKDGYNMARRTPIADGLGKALEILQQYGYKVITVKELVEHYSPFEDLGTEDVLYPSVKHLHDRGYTVAFRNNKILSDTPMTRGALAMLIYGQKAIKRRIAIMEGKQKLRTGDVKPAHPYSGAIRMALENGSLTLIGNKFRPDAQLDKAAFEQFCRNVYGRIPELHGELTHGNVIHALARLEGLEG